MKRAKPQYSKNFSYLLKLLACVLNDTKTPKPNADTDWASVFYLAKCHSVAGMVYYALMRMDKEDLPSEDILSGFQECYNIDLLKETNMDLEAREIFRIFAENNIPVLPVKGFLIKNDYPEKSMRTMTDIDLLCRNEHFPQVSQIFLKRGYSIKDHNNIELDITKAPFHHYEVHSLLIKNNRSYGEYYENFMDRAKASEDKNYLTLSSSDSYIYLLSHLAKHLESGGAGIRMIMDVYVFLKAHKSELSQEYIQTELEKIRLHKFRNIVEKMAHSWFSGEEPVTDTLAADYILCSTTFGTGKNSILSSSLYYEKTTGKKHTGTGRTIKSVFPNLDELYPRLKKARILYPYYWLCYWFNRVFRYRNLNVDNLKNYYLRTDSDEGKKIERMLYEMGLDIRIDRNDKK